MHRDLEVKVAGSRTDAEIAQTVRNALEWDVFVPHRIEPYAL